MTRRQKLLSGALLGGILGIISAQASFAQEEPAADVRYEKKTYMDFTDVRVEGEVARPEGTYLPVVQKRTFRNMIKMRASFTPELERSQPKL